MDLRRSMNGAIAGAAGAAVWAAQQPLDKRLFDSEYDDVELLGKLVTREDHWPAVGLALHLQNGALFGAAYSQARAFIPGPPATRGVVAALVENFGLWPLSRWSDRLHPARKSLAPLAGNRRALAQATWRHLVFGVVMGEIERRLNAPDEYEPPGVPVASNGRGNIEHAAAAAT
jgi:hypothetical protein